MATITCSRQRQHDSVGLFVAQGPICIIFPTGDEPTTGWSASESILVLPSNKSMALALCIAISICYNHKKSRVNERVTKTVSKCYKKEELSQSSFNFYIHHFLFFAQLTVSFSIYKRCFRTKVGIFLPMDCANIAFYTCRP